MAMRIVSKTNNNNQKVNVIVEEVGQDYRIFGVDDCDYKVVDKKAYRKAANQINVLNTLRGKKPIDDTDPKFDTITLNKQIIGQHIHALNNVRTLYAEKVDILNNTDAQVSFDVNSKTLNIDIPIFSVFANLYNIYKSSSILNEHDALYNLLHAYNSKIIDHTGTQSRYILTPENVGSASNQSSSEKYANVHNLLSSSEKDIQECLMRSIYSRFSQAQIGRADAYITDQLTKLMNLGTTATKDSIKKETGYAMNIYQQINQYIAANVDHHKVRMIVSKSKKVHYKCGHNTNGEPKGFVASMCFRISIKVDSLVSKTDTNTGNTVYTPSNVTKLRELLTIDELLMSL